jgi:small-conductance mechanosensitive channel
MLTEILPFSFKLDTIAIAGASLWSLALYLAFFPVSEWVIQQITRWFNFASRSLYANESEFERTRKARESRNAFYASLFSIVPFLAIGALCNWGVELTLGRSWAISMGILACMGCGVYELGRRDGQSSE